jgi:acyl dehydratase
MRVFDGVSGLPDAVGQQLGHSEWHTITQDQVDQFAEATGDHQWIHVDPARAANGPFGGTIAHGYLTLSMAPMLGQEVYRFDNVTMAINYGSNKVRFPQPVRVGSRVRAGVELAQVTPGSRGTQVVFRFTIEIEGADKPACVAETVALIVP